MDHRMGAAAWQAQDDDGPTPQVWLTHPLGTPTRVTAESEARWAASEARAALAFEVGEHAPDPEVMLRSIQGAEAWLRAYYKRPVTTLSWASCPDVTRRKAEHFAVGHLDSSMLRLEERVGDVVTKIAGQLLLAYPITAADAGMVLVSHGTTWTVEVLPDD